MSQLKAVTLLHERGEFLHVNRSVSDCFSLEVLAHDVFNVLVSSLKAFYSVLAFSLIS